MGRSGRRLAPDRSCLIDQGAYADFHPGLEQVAEGNGKGLVAFPAQFLSQLVIVSFGNCGFCLLLLVLFFGM